MILRRWILRFGMGSLMVAMCGPVKAQDSLRLLTWNIQMLPAPAKSKGKARRAQVIAELLVHSPYDVVIFQEAFQKKSRKIITRQLKSVFPYHTAVLNKKSIALKTNGGVVLFSKFPICNVHEIRFHRRTGYDRMARKGALLAEIDVYGKRVQIAGTHLQAFGAEEIMYSQYQQLRDELLDPHKRPGVPQLICGDFNTLKRPPDVLPSGITAEQISRLPRFDRMLMTLDAEDGMLSGEQQFTMDRPYNDLCEKRKEFRLLLDYVLLRPNGISGYSMNRKVKIFRKQWHPEHKDLSDHFGVEATLSGF